MSEKTILGLAKGALALAILMLILVMFTPPAKSQISGECVSMDQVHSVMQELNAEPDPKTGEWFEEYKEAFKQLGGDFNSWPEGVDQVFVAVSNSHNIVLFGFFKNGCIIDDAVSFRLDMYNRVLTQMERNRT